MGLDVLDRLEPPKQDQLDRITAATTMLRIQQTGSGHHPLALNEIAKASFGDLPVHMQWLAAADQLSNPVTPSGYVSLADLCRRLTTRCQ